MDTSRASSKSSTRTTRSSTRTSRTESSSNLRPVRSVRKPSASKSVSSAYGSLTRQSSALEKAKPEMTKTRHARSVSVPPWKAIAPWPDQEEKLKLEKSFVLDGIALNNFQDSYGQVQPKLGSAIPPYNSHYDRHAANYFNNKGLTKTLRKTEQMKDKSESIEGKYVDHFHLQGGKFDYLHRRNRHGAGHARELIEGHSRFMKGIQPINGYNGQFGFRRNVPHLRIYPTTFGVTDRTREF